MKKDLFEIEKDLFDGNSTSEFKALIQLEKFERDPNFLVSENFLEQEELLKELFSIDIKPSETESNENKKTIEGAVTYGSDTIVIRGWKNVENISARLIEHFDETVVLECLIDKEMGVYEEREFRISLFADYETKIGNLFLLRIFERQNEIRIEIHNDPELTLKDDFPKLSFVEKFKDSSLFKKK